MCTMAAPAVAAATAAAAICSGVMGQCGLLVTLVSSPVMAQVMKTSWFMTMPAAGKYYGVDNIIMGDTAASRGMLRQRARWRSCCPRRIFMQTQMLIGGRLLAGEGPVEQVLDAASGLGLASVASASAPQVDAAVAAAEAAFDGWAHTCPKDRAALLLKIAD